ncbi:preprotein translocase subunit SecG [Hydrogenophaga soli]
MNFLSTLLLVLQVVSAVAMIGLILVQHGKGADAGAAFGSGGSGSASLFGASGSANFLSRTTAILATVFLVCTLAMAAVGGQRKPTSGSVLEGVAAPVQAPASGEAKPAEPAQGAGQIPAK